MPLPVPDISRNLFDLSGYCSIVTGAGQGIGLVLAEALAYAGSDLVLTERNAEHLKVAAGEIKAIGRNVTTVACDVAADDTPDRLVKAALALSGRIDVLINNAGFMTFADMLTVEDAVWDNIYAVNVRAPMRITRAVLPEMVKAKRGSVINIGSSWSSRSFRVQSGWRRRRLSFLEGSVAMPYARCRAGCGGTGGAGQCHRARCGRHADARRSPRQTLRVRKVHPARPHAARGRYRRHSDLPRLGRQRLHHGADPAR